jgi:glycolate oxidase iron-sulfur subunit
MAREIDATTIDTAIRVLTRLGFDVLIPAEQTCCGALHRDSGDSARADALLEQNAAAFAATGSDILLTLVSGCGAALADATAGPDRRLDVQVRDISEFLAAADLPTAMELAPLARTVAIQDPCTLRNVLRAEHGVYRLLGRIPGITLTPLPENHLCCGGAGAYPLREPHMAERLRAPKLDHLAQLRPDLLVSANLGCVLHMRAGLANQGLDLEIVHPIVLFERQLRSST